MCMDLLTSDGMWAHLGVVCTNAVVPQAGYLVTGIF